VVVEVGGVILVVGFEGVWWCGWGLKRVWWCEFFVGCLDGFEKK